MIHAYVPRESAVDRLELQPGQQVPEGAVWLACFGAQEQLDAVNALGDQLRDEPPFVRA